MQFIDLATQQAHIKERIDTRIQAVLAHGQYIMGPEVKELEDALCAFTGSPYTVGCASGTTALDLVLTAWNIGPGDAVFTTPLSFIATAEAIFRRGAAPVFVDIDKHTYNMDVHKLEQAITAVLRDDASLHPLPRHTAPLTPKAIVVVDLFGNPVDYDTLLPLARKYDLPVLEDGAQALGSRYKDKMLCHCGCQAATTSFFPAKPLGCYGDGGAVFTDDATLAALVDSLRYHGRASAKNKNDNIHLGFNGRIDTLQAAILLAKLEIFPQELQQRAAAGQRYGRMLAAKTPDVGIPLITEGGETNWAQYSILLPQGHDRARVMAFMKEQGIPTAINYPKGMHTQGCMSPLGYAAHDFPVTEQVTAHVLSLPMHPYLTEEVQETITTTLARALETCHD